MDALISIANATMLDWMPRKNGRPLHVATLHRWATRGIGGVRLHTVKVGRTTCVTIEELCRFFKALSEADLRKVQPIARPATSLERERAAQRARQILRMDTPASDKEAR